MRSLTFVRDDTEIMKQFTTLTSTALPLKLDSIDTDQIVPARFLKAITREGFGDKLFRDWRFDKNDKPTDFILNDPKYKDAKILLAAKDFGTGSSREHAAWAILDYGFHAVIAESFGDIFYNNSLKNGLLVVRLKEAEIHALHELLKKNHLEKITIDLPNQRVTTESGLGFSFDIDPFRKTCLVKGVDDLGYLLALDKEITAFEGQVASG